MKILKSKDGMTMVEVIIAFVIFMLSLVMVSVSLQYAVTTQARYSERKKWLNGYMDYSTGSSVAEYQDGLLSYMYKIKSKEDAAIETNGTYRKTVKVNSSGYMDSFVLTAADTDTASLGLSFVLPLEPAMWVIKDEDENDFTYSSGRTVEIPLYDVDDSDYQTYRDNGGGY